MKRALRCRTVAITMVCAMFAPACSDMAPPLDITDVSYKPGKGGKSNFVSTTWTFRDLAGDNAVSDGRDLGAGIGAYADGDCNVIATINEFGDAQMNLGFARIKGKDRARCGDRRMFTVEFDDPDDGVSTMPPVSEDGVIKVDDITSVAVGTTGDRAARISVSSCEGGLGLGGANFPGSNPVQVTRVNSDEWLVEAAAGALALCASTGLFYRVPFAITINE